MKTPTQFTTYTVETASEASKPFLIGAKQAFGFLPNLLGGMAESPALLEGYMSVAGIFNKTALSETERQIILMTSNRLNDCTYCMAAHTTISQGAKVPANVIAALRNDTPIADAKLEALRQFTIKLVESRGWPADADVQSFMAAGYTRQSLLDVILGTSLKVMSNYFNHIAQTPVDTVFQANAWSASK
ncbi:MAG: carboxymuconolactone decarboxylase family protein [Betaproteobacteria bacterium]|nr:carboxymuconolactone decarboxylase family protein [Betaproteobacteria bacterium]